MACYDLRDEDGVNVNGVAIDDTTSVLEIVNLTLHLREVLTLYDKQRPSRHPVVLLTAYEPVGWHMSD